MTQHPVTFHQVTVPEAAGILGASTQTVRCMLRRGQFEGQRVHRRQGTAYVVNPPVDGAAGDIDATATQQPAGNVSRANATAQPAAAEAIAAMIQVTLTPIIAPLVGELAASRQQNERQADQMVSQAETIGTLRAENQALLARTAVQPVEPTTGYICTHVATLARSSAVADRRSCADGDGAAVPVGAGGVVGTST